MSEEAPDGVARRRDTPGLSLLLGFGAMIPFALGAAGAWLVPPERPALFTLTALWGCAILLFLSGVRRGLSFRTQDGPTGAQIATSLGLFALGFLALLMFAFGLGATLPLWTLLLGYVCVAVLDPIAARRGEAPLFFARLRPVQMLIPVASLLALAILAAQ